MKEHFNLVATAAAGLEAVVGREVRALGIDCQVDNGKVYFEGDTRARELGSTDTHDQTIDTQIQTKVGVGCVFSNVFGKYTTV